MATLPKAMRLPVLKREILRLFTKADIRHIAEADTERVQKVVASLITPPALSQDMPSAQEYQQVYALLCQMPEKTDKQKALPATELSVGSTEISILMQAIAKIPAETIPQAMRQKMNFILKSMAQGHMQAWVKLSQSTQMNDMRMYAFLCEALLRARRSDSSRLQQSPVKRSRKLFWDGGVSL